MAIYHLTTKIISRSKGHSAVAAAAYRARTEIFNKRTGEVWDYSRKHADVLFTGIYAPKDAPEWMNDRAQLWNQAELAEKRKDAQVARDFIIGMPHELTEEQQRYALQDWIRENFTRRGYVADAAIHRPSEAGDQRNTHAHVLVTMRVVDGEQFAAKKERSSDRLADLEQWRDSWEKIGNRHLTRHGHPASLDRRSLEEQGIDREPQIHVGKDATEMEREGKQTDRGDLLSAIHAENLARELKKRFGHTVAVSELQRPEWPEATMQAAAIEHPQNAVSPQPADPRRAPKGQGILATIWTLVRHSGAFFGGLLLGSVREEAPIEYVPGLIYGDAPEIKSPVMTKEPPKADRPSPATTLLERLGVAETKPPALTRELTMVEKMQQRLKQEVTLDNPRADHDRQHKRIKELELDF